MGKGSPVSRPLQPGTVLGALLVLAATSHAALFFRNGLSDDGYIEFRYARNLASGKGFVFNPGERVDGSGGPAWVCVLALADHLGLPPETSSRLMGIALSGLASLGAMALGAASGGRIGGLLAGVLVAADPSLAMHANSGLNTLLCVAVATGALGLLARGAEAARPPLAPLVLAGLAPAVRSEGLLVTGVVLAAAALRWRGLDRRFAATLALAAAPFLWRWIYFGDPLPNAFYAKKADLDLDLSDGSVYAWGWILGPHGVLLAAGALGLLPASPRSRAGSLASLGLVASFLAFGIWAGGDFFPGHRLLLPAAPALAAFAAAGLVRLSRLPRLPAAGGLVLAVLGTLGLAAWLAAPSSRMRQGLEIVRAFDQRWNAVGRALREKLSPDCSIAVSAIGAVGYRSELPVVDILGLVDRHIARRPAYRFRHAKGHQKFDGAYVLSRRPDLLLLGNMVTHPIGDPEAKVPHLIWEEDIWRDPAFARDYERIVIPIEGDYDFEGQAPLPFGPLICFRRRDSPCGR